jgi:hypothetical protein
MSRGAVFFSGFFKALIFVFVFLLATAIPSESAPSPAHPITGSPDVLTSLQDQCLSRAERSQSPDRMRAICIGWALLAIEKGELASAKAEAMRDTCLREVRFGAEGQIREYRAQGEALCRNFHASVAPL